MADCFLVFFRSGACDLDTAAHALTARKLAVGRDGDRVIASYPGSPEFRVALDAGPHVLPEAEEIASGTPHAASLAGCDARFDVSFPDLAEALDEFNTLLEVQAALQEASRGYLFLPWNGHLGGPDEA